MHRSNNGLIAAALVASALGCNDPLAETFSDSDDSRREEFEQPLASPSDVLFVVDSSGSMDDEQEALAANFPSFVAFFFEHDLSFRIGFTTTNIEDPNSDGLDGEFVGGGWLESETAGRDAIVQRALVGIDPGHGREKGLHAAWATISQHPEFLRDEAHLAVVVVSDEPDYSTLDEDDAGDFVDAGTFAEWLDGVKPEGDADDADLSAIVGVPEEGLEEEGGCGGNTGEPGTGAMRGDGYLEAALATGGTYASICDDDWAEMLGRMGLRSAGLVDRFPLQEPADPDTVQVWVDDVPVQGFVYRHFDNSVEFLTAADVPPEGSTVVVRYLLDEPRQDP